MPATTLTQEAKRFILRNHGNLSAYDSTSYVGTNLVDSYCWPSPSGSSSEDDDEEGWVMVEEEAASRLAHPKDDSSSVDDLPSSTPSETRPETNRVNSVSESNISREDDEEEGRVMPEEKPTQTSDTDDEAGSEMRQAQLSDEEHCADDDDDDDDDDEWETEASSSSFSSSSLSFTFLEAEARFQEVLTNQRARLVYNQRRFPENTFSTTDDSDLQQYDTESSGIGGGHESDLDHYNFDNC